MRVSELAASLRRDWGARASHRRLPYVMIPVVRRLTAELRLDGHGVDHVQTLYIAERDECALTLRGETTTRVVVRRDEVSPSLLFPRQMCAWRLTAGLCSPASQVVSLVDGRLLRKPQSLSAICLSVPSLPMAWQGGQRHTTNYAMSSLLARSDRAVTAKVSHVEMSHEERGRSMQGTATCE